jgi:hypothetical protein
LKSPAAVAFGVFLGAAGYLLVTEHLAHTIDALPWVILALCPLMHFFMHRSHGRGGDHPGDRR